jgi:hypothetical protein
MALISGTYSEETIVKKYLVTDLYDATTLSANIALQAASAKVKVNNFIGRQTDFTTTELALNANEDIVEAASQLTACLMEVKRQEGTPKITEEAKRDCEEAYAMLTKWMQTNGITPPANHKQARTDTFTYLYGDPDYVIGAL